MNSVSTDTRGAVLTMNLSFHTEHTVLLQHHLVFSDLIQAVRLWHHWLESAGRWSPVFHIITYSSSYGNSPKFYWSEYLKLCSITMGVSKLQQSRDNLLSVISHCCTHCVDLWVSGFGSFETCVMFYVRPPWEVCDFWRVWVAPISWVLQLIPLLSLTLADRRKHPSEGGGNLEDQPVFPRGQSTYLSNSACKARAADWGFTVQMPGG